MSSPDLATPLQTDGWAVELHKALFPGEGEKADHDWIPIVTERGHAIITSDKNQKSWNAEDGKVRPAIERCGAKVFFLRGTGLTPAQQADAVKAAKAAIRRHVKRCFATFIIARIHPVGSRLGEIQVLHQAEGTDTYRKYGKD